MTRYILQQAELGEALSKDELAEQKHERARINFMRQELTTAENFMNVQKVQPFIINQNSEYNFNR